MNICHSFYKSIIISCFLFLQTKKPATHKIKELQTSYTALERLPEQQN